jgi:hypothetical protein
VAVTDSAAVCPVTGEGVAVVAEITGAASLMVIDADAETEALVAVMDALPVDAGEVYTPLLLLIDPIPEASDQLNVG